MESAGWVTCQGPSMRTWFQNFLGIDSEAAANAMRTYYNKHTRLSPEDSESLKRFSGFNDTQYQKFNCMLFYFTGLRILAPLKSIWQLRATNVDKAYTTMNQTVVDIGRVTKKNGSHISRKIQVGVVTIRPFECIYNSAGSLLRHGMMLPLATRFRRPRNVPPNVRNVLLWKFSADKGGWSWEMLINPVNVKRPQSLCHVQPICKFTANDSRANMEATIFHDGSACKADMEDVLHRRCTLLRITIGIQMEVALVVNSNRRHHQSRPMALANAYEAYPYTPSRPELAQENNSFDKRVARVDFSIVTG